MEQSLPFFSRRFLLSDDIRLQLSDLQKPLYLASKNVTGHFVQIGNLQKSHYPASRNVMGHFVQIDQANQADLEYSQPPSLWIPSV